MQYKQGLYSVDFGFAGEENDIDTNSNATNIKDKNLGKNGETTTVNKNDVATSNDQQTDIQMTASTGTGTTTTTGVHHPHLTAT